VADACAQKPCLNRGQCVNYRSGSSYVCFCNRLHRGAICELQSNTCGNDSPCLNGGTCFVDQNGQLACLCAPGFRGPRCKTPSDVCLQSPCLNGGSCFDAGNGAYKCVCLAGYSGETCQKVTASCSSKSCLNKGVCEPSEALHKFICKCPRGFIGTRCERKDACLDEPCLNGATCETMYVQNTAKVLRKADPKPKAKDEDQNTTVRQYSCLCAEGYKGVTCELNATTGALAGLGQNTCSPNPCLNGGRCRVSIRSDAGMRVVLMKIMT